MLKFLTKRQKDTKHISRKHLIWNQWIRSVWLSCWLTAAFSHVQETQSITSSWRWSRVSVQLTNTSQHPLSTALWFVPSTRRLHAGLSLLPTHLFLLSAVSCGHEAPLSVFGFICWKHLRCSSMIHHHLLAVTVDLLTVNTFLSRRKPDSVFHNTIKSFKCHNIQMESICWV